ncbi:hypothetical protein P4J60_02045 [Bacillus cereus]|nr:hypothetical protein [Bacillus cereus]MEB9566087.1 hypothetical protein [Bacillus cereus]
MGAIVHELQREAQKSNNDISALLRKAYVVARKLNIVEFKEWIDNEIHGYKDYDSVPEYRRVHGEFKAFNPYRGWIPIIEMNSNVASKLSNKKLMEPISELQASLNNSGKLAVKYGNEIRPHLGNLSSYEGEFATFFSKTQVERVIDSIRNIVLDWSLNLEEDGILGENMSFSSEEKEKAQNNSSITNIFHGNATGIQIQQQTSNSNQSMQQNHLDIQKIEELLKTIKENLEQIDLDSGQKATINTNIEMIEKQKQLSNPNPVIIKEGFSTIRNVLEGVTGSLIASGIIHHLGLFLS